MKNMKKQDTGLTSILIKYIEEHHEVWKQKTNSDCIDCENDCYFNDTISKSMELWDYEIKDVYIESSFNEVKLDMVVASTVYLSSAGSNQDDGNEITKHFQVEVILDFDQFQIKCVGVSVED